MRHPFLVSGYVALVVADVYSGLVMPYLKPDDLPESYERPAMIEINVSGYSSTMSASIVGTF